MNSIPNPDDWLDVITILVATAIVAIPSWLTARNHKLIKSVKDQVVNGHTTPMRADLDVIKGDVAGLRDELRGGFADIRADLNEERAARRAGDATLRDELEHRTGKGIRP